MASTAMVTQRPCDFRGEDVAVLIGVGRHRQRADGKLAARLRCCGLGAGVFGLRHGKIPRCRTSAAVSEVAHLAAVAILRPRLGGRFTQQVVEIEPAGDHVELAVRRARPKLLRPVAIELDPVLVGIAQRERLAHAMVGSAVERNAGRNETAERVRQRGARRIEDREMIEPGGPGRRRRSAQTLPGVERDVMMIAAGRDEGGAGSPLGELEAQHAAIEFQRPLEIGDFEMHVADPDPAIDRPRGQGFAGFRHLPGTAHDAPPGLGPNLWRAGRLRHHAACDGRRRSIAISRSLVRWIFVPFALCVTGKASRNHTRAGTLKAAMIAAAPATISASLAAEPSAGMTKAAQRIRPSSSTPTTWASATAPATGRPPGSILSSSGKASGWNANSA